MIRIPLDREYAKDQVYRAFIQAGTYKSNNSLLTAKEIVVRKNFDAKGKKLPPDTAIEVQVRHQKKLFFVRIWQKEVTFTIGSFYRYIPNHKCIEIAIGDSNFSDYSLLLDEHDCRLDFATFIERFQTYLQAQ